MENMESFFFYLLFVSFQFTNEILSFSTAFSRHFTSRLSEESQGKIQRDGLKPDSNFLEILLCVGSVRVNELRGL